MVSPTDVGDDYVTIAGVPYKRRIETSGGRLGEPMGLPGVYDVDLVSEFDDASGRYITRSVRVEGRDGAEVTGEVLRALKIEDILRNNTRSFNGVPDEHPSDLLELGKAGPTDATLRAVARVYEVGLAFRDAPTERVATAFGVPRSTAGRWVTRSRDRGYLTRIDRRAPGSGSRKGRANG